MAIYERYSSSNLTKYRILTNLAQNKYTHLNNWPTVILNEFTPLTQKELTLVSRVALNPTLRQIDLARTLDVTRSAVNQIWKRLAREHHLKVKSLVNYGKLGINWIFGWAEDSTISPELDKFVNWLTLTPYATQIEESIISSSMNRVIYFEALVPFGEKTYQFKQQLDRFRKRPYDIQVDYDHVDHTRDALNLGRFDGSKWNLEDEFRLSTIMGATKSFVEILPIERTLRIGHEYAAPTEFAIAAILQRDYHVSSRKLQKALIEKFALDIADRTLRRKLPQIRSSFVMPYVSIDQIGLTQTILFHFKFIDDSTNMTRFLHAQTNMFPKTRILFGRGMAVLRLRLPSNVNWLAMTESFMHNLKGTSDVTACIIDAPLLQKELEHVYPYFVKHSDKISRREMM